MATNNEKIASEILKELELQEKYRIDIVASSRRVEELRKSLIDSYPKFIEGCLRNNPNKFVDIKKFPTTEEIRSFYQYGSPSITDDILMYEYGWFDIKELAVIIKLLYSLKKQKEYSIVTLANLEEEYFGPEDSDKRIVPYMNFLIGLDKNQKYLSKYNGKYFDKPSLEGNILDDFKRERHPNSVILKQGMWCSGNDNFASLNIDFENIFGAHPVFMYLDPLSNWDTKAVFSSSYNIFDKYFGEVLRRLAKKPRSKASGLLSFSLDFQDAFIARTLFSIVIYKKKMNKLVLDNEDYKYIFYELFKEDVDVLGFVDKEIPKVLTRYK